MLKPCIICFRLADGTDLSPAEDVCASSNTINEAFLSGKTPDQVALSRFFKILERYLDGSPSGRKAAEQSKPFDLEGAIHAGLISCTDCSKLVESFCDLHHQMKSAELLLNWKLWTLKNIMLCGQRVPSRMKDFREYADRLEIEDIDTDDILQYRRDLVAKCKRKLSTTFPKPTIKKFIPPGSEAPKLPAALFSQSDEVNHAADLTPIHEIDDSIELQDPEVNDDGLEAKENVAANSLKDNRNSRKLEEQRPPPSTSRLRHHHRCPTCWKTFSTQERMDKHNQIHMQENSAPEHANEPLEELLKEVEVDKGTDLSAQKSKMAGRKTKRYGWGANSQIDNYKCRLCTNKFERKESLYLHFQSVHLNPNYQCPKCSKVCTQKRNLKTHLRNAHFEWWSKVENKDKALASAKQGFNLKDERLVTLTNSPLLPAKKKAGRNRAIFMKPTHFPEMMPMPPAEDIPSANDNDCQSWSTVDPLTGKHICSRCSKQLATPYSLKIHYQNLHLKLRYNCQKCGKEFTLKDNLKTHMQRIHLGRSFKCSFCPLSFSTRMQRYRHVRTGCQKRTNWNGTNGSDDIDSSSEVQPVQHYYFVTTNLVEVKYEATSRSEIVEDINSGPTFPANSEGRMEVRALGAGSESETFILADQVPVIQPSGSGIELGLD